MTRLGSITGRILWRQYQKFTKIEWLSKVKEEKAMIFLDDQNAFDQVSSKYPSQTLKQFQFGPDFIKWIQTL